MISVIGAGWFIDDVSVNGCSGGFEAGIDTARFERGEAHRRTWGLPPSITECMDEREKKETYKQ
jgi:hypothetical protein